VTGRPLERLYSPIELGGVRIRNRIAMAPMATDYADEDGRVSLKLIDYHAARAAGGVGLIFMEVTAVDERYPYIPRTVGLWSDALVPGYRQLTDAIHAHGAKLMPQIAHAGPDSLSSLLTGHPAVGPTAGIRNTLTKTGCREMSREEIEEIPAQFAHAARRAREAGCDGIELHAAHAYMLLGSFLSALRNRRTDEYGGSVENRMRLPLEVIDAIRSMVGRDFPIVLRISADELVFGGRDLQETLSIAPRFVEAGVDAFHVSSGAYPDLAWRVIPPTGTPLALNAAFSKALKAVVDVPVLVVGRINDARLAEAVLARGEADMAVMGRALIADPELPAKSARGDFDDVAPCIGCGLGCVTAREKGGDMTCLVNPRVGRERETEPAAARGSERVMVAGAGPAGLMAAWTAAARGNQVDLYEARERLGGLYNLAAVAPGKQELTRVIQYLARQCRNSGVTLHTGVEVTPALVSQAAPDHLIVATGSRERIPEIRGADGPTIVLARQVLEGGVSLSGRILVAGGGTTGCEVAEMLACHGDSLSREPVEVLVVEMREAAGEDMFDEARTLLMERLRARGVRFLTSARLVELTRDGAVVDRAAGRETLRGFAWIVIATGARAYDPLSGPARAQGLRVTTIGDARIPGQAVAAIADGFEAGRSME
jgi:NAD(H)-dependent 7beta-hydroxy-3-oxo-delta4-cholenoic acid oxidoreductase